MIFSEAQNPDFVLFILTKKAPASGPRDAAVVIETLLPTLPCPGRGNFGCHENFWIHRGW